MNLDLFDHAEPDDVQTVSPTGQPVIAGHTEQARHASATGAAKAVETWTENQSEILQLLRNEPLSRPQLSALTGLPINSICSLLQGLIDAGIVEASGDVDVQIWANQRRTVREKFRIRR
jgi:predicted HTH transcriptional regulator